MHRNIHNRLHSYVYVPEPYEWLGIVASNAARCLLLSLYAKRHNRILLFHIFNVCRFATIHRDEMHSSYAIGPHSTFGSVTLANTALSNIIYACNIDDGLCAGWWLNGSISSSWVCGWHILMAIEFVSIRFLPTMQCVLGRREREKEAGQYGNGFCDDWKKQIG